MRICRLCSCVDAVSLLGKVASAQLLAPTPKNRSAVDPVKSLRAATKSASRESHGDHPLPHIHLSGQRSNVPTEQLKCRQDLGKRCRFRLGDGLDCFRPQLAPSLIRPRIGFGAGVLQPMELDRQEIVLEASEIGLGDRFVRPTIQPAAEAGVDSKPIVAINPCPTYFTRNSPRPAF